MRVVERARHGGARDRGGYDGAFVEHHPRLGWLGIPGRRVRHRTTEFDCEVALNARGLRQREPPPLERRAGMRRVAVLGDSFTFGQGVPEEARFTEALAATLPDCEVVNCGLIASGTDQQVLLYEELAGPHANADVVVLAYTLENVVRNGARQRYGRAKPYFELTAAGELELAGVPVPAQGAGSMSVDGGRARGLALPFKTWLRRNSRLYAFLRNRLAERVHRALDTDAADPYPEYGSGAAAWGVTRALFERLARSTRERGARLVVMLIPEPWHLRSTGSGARDTHQRAVRAACASSGIAVLDLTPVLVQHFGERVHAAYRPVDGHWTAAAHALAGHELARFLVEQQCLP